MEVENSDSEKLFSDFYIHKSATRVNAHTQNIQNRTVTSSGTVFLSSVYKFVGQDPVHVLGILA